ncbi:MAG: 4Fe-4S dicluster domain-containing protein, partial [Clostridia bacterium]|nr:4Fe-4S dicluster domain-containing protein [Clostridia bacterium]
ALPEATDNQYFESFVRPIVSQKGNNLPVSVFNPAGIVPTGTTQFEKRGIAVNLPAWDVAKCIQCNQCAFVCPHAAIRPVLVDETVELPESFTTKAAIGVKGAKFRIQVSPLDCTGCGSCANVCPSKEKALVMTPADKVHEEENYKFAQTVKTVESTLNPSTVKGSQFKQPLFEFSGACAGCGETPYVKLVTQLFGEQMMIANATGCSSIYGGSAPTCPYTVNKDGHGPAWANSLFEDNAEFGFGYHLAVSQRRTKLKETVEKLLAIWEEKGKNADGVAAAREWLEGFDDTAKSKAAAAKLVANCQAHAECECCGELIAEVLKSKDMLVKKSIWIFGGDGWAYDIGYGGLDHVLASGEDVNILVMDTEVYSNTGGQASKASPTAAVAKFAAAGKRTKKKDLGMMAMSYGYVYVAQVGMGASQAQLVKALTEAEAYKGPSLIIAYAPCINHGINMGKSQEEIKRAVDCGYWQLYRYNPTLVEQGKNPFTLDSKDPTGSYRDFIMSETRYASLAKTKPEIADELFGQSEADALGRVAKYKKLAGQE